MIAIEPRNIALRHLHIIARARPLKFLQRGCIMIPRRLQRRAALRFVRLHLPLAEPSKRGTRLFCVAAHRSGTLSRVRSCSASRKAATASSRRAVPLSLAEHSKRIAEIVLRHGP